MSIISPFVIFAAKRSDIAQDDVLDLLLWGINLHIVKNQFGGLLSEVFCLLFARSIRPRVHVMKAYLQSFHWDFIIS